MTLTETRPIPALDQEATPDAHPAFGVIKEAQQRHRRRLARTAVVSVSIVVLIVVVGLLGAEGGAGRGTPAAPTNSAARRSQGLHLASTNTHPGFVLLPRWLPPGFSASAGGWIQPVGGLKVGNKAGVSVEFGEVGPTSKTRVDPVLFTLSYYGYHNPESKNIRLTATRYGFPPQGNLEALGGRHVEISSKFVPGYFGGNTNSSASWVEHGEYIEVMAQGITEAQLSRFVAGLKEHPPPKSS